MNRHTLSKRLGVDYTTIHDRIRELSEQGIVEEKGQRPGEKNKKQSAVLWGIAALGLWLAVHAGPMTSRKDSRALERGRSADGPRGDRFQNGAYPNMANLV